MWIWFAVFTVYVIARMKRWRIREWLEILLAGLCLFFLLRI